MEINNISYIILFYPTNMHLANIAPVVNKMQSSCLEQLEEYNLAGKLAPKLVKDETFSD